MSELAVGDEVLAKVREAMGEAGLDAIVPMSPENLAYASGAAPPSQKTVRSRLAAAIIPADGADTEVVTVKLEAPLVRSQSRLDRVTAYEEFVEHPIDVIAASLRERGLGSASIGVEIGYLTHADYERFREALPDADLRPVDALWQDLRMLKTGSEIDAIRHIGQAAQRITEECVKLVSVGSTERELGNLITERYHQAGGDALTMLVVGSGERSAHLNAPPTDRVLRPGDIVRTDVIGTAGHYYSDVARTAIVGEPTAEQRKVYGLLYDVHRRCLEALRPGAISSDIYAIYHDAMTEAGLPAYHFVGHGLGVTLHEEPFINPLTSIPLEEGMVLCIEPLTSVEGEFGMQIEDEVLITADGFELLTEASDILTIGA
ncbi:MAG: aminopeptidase P family protein [Thermoleophilaceae bacterium]|nr:aminopeptidase P family protein [Thermoleophilaceae bacterium]